MSRPLAIDLYCGLGGWAEGFLAEGYYVVGFDIERHDYGTGGYPGQLVLQDVLTLDGSQFKNATVIVASPPCQAYSYRAMPWKRAKALPPPDNTLFEACFRIQREASEAASRRIPLIVENVCGAQKWVGRAAWHFGSYYLWGDLPALMPIAKNGSMKFGASCSARNWSERPIARLGDAGGIHHREGTKGRGQDWNRFSKTGEVSPHWVMEGLKTTGHLNKRDGHPHTRHLTNPEQHLAGVKGFRPDGEPLGKNTLGQAFFSKDPRRKMASAMIAKIPFPLARHIAKCFKPQ